MLRRAESALRPLFPRRTALAPLLVPALLVLLPSLALALVNAVGPGSPWSLGACVASAVLAGTLVARRGHRPAIPLAGTFLWAAAGFGCLCVLAVPLGSPTLSTLSVLALVYLTAAFVAAGPGPRPAAPRPRAATRSAERNVAAVFAGLVVLAGLLPALRLATSLQPATGLFTTDSLDIYLAGHPWSLGLGAAKLALLADSLGGGLLLAACARELGARRLFAAAAGIAWATAGARLGPEFWNATPTFLVPLFALVLVRRLPVAAALVAALTGLLYWPLLVPLGVLTLGWWLWQPAAAQRNTVARAVAAGALGGIVLALVPGSLVRPPATLVAAPLDGALRVLGADGVWPWTLLFPSLTSALYGGAAQLLLAASGFAGNALWITAAPGWALLAALAGAALTFRRRAPRATRAGAAVVLAVVFLALPSHIFSVPLPTAAELTYLAGGSGWLPSSVALALVAVAALAGALTLTTLVERGASVAVVAGLVLILLDAVPSAALFPNLAAASAVGALREARAEPRSSALFPSLYANDPRARLARAETEFLFALSPVQARTFVRTLPLKESLRASDLDLPTLRVAVADMSAYNLYRDAPFAGFIFVPNDLTGNVTAPDQVTNPEIDETVIESVYGSDYAYSPRR